MSYFNPDNTPPFQLPVSMNELSRSCQAIVGAELRELVIRKADEFIDEIGFGWTAITIDHPDCHELNRRVAAAIANKTPLQISNTHIDRTLLLDANAEGALRYWRTVVKIRQRSCQCDVASELRCDISLVDDAVLSGVSRIASVYLFADLVGATMLRSSGYGMSISPLEYTLDVLALGIPEAILMEIVRREDARHGLDAAA